MSNGFEIFYYVLNSIVLVFTIGAMLIKPFRERILGINKMAKEKKEEQASRRETDKCLLRNSISAVYYKYSRDGEIKQYDYENVAFMYKQYKSLGGNSFVDKIWSEMQDWKIIR